MFTRRVLLRTARLLVGAILLAQAALAIAACEWGARDSARAVAMAGASENAPCHESGAQGAGSGQCLGHCMGDRQSLDRPAGALSTLAPAALVAVVSVSNAVGRLHEPRRARPLAAAAPPPRILFQSFLI